MNEVILKDILQGMHQGIVANRYVVQEEPDNVRTRLFKIVKNANLADTPLRISGHCEVLTLEDRPSLEKYKLRGNDVLISQRFRDFCAASVDAAFLKSLENGLSAVPSNNSILLRPDPRRLLGPYLAIFLSTPKGLERVNQASKLVEGKSKFAGFFLWTTPKEIGKIKIPLPSLSQQKEAIETYRSALLELKAETAAAEARYRDRVDRLFEMK